jgi:hypothetical protein
MNVFEDLIEELKDENLLEETVIETSASTNDAVDPIKRISVGERSVDAPEPGAEGGFEFSSVEADEDVNASGADLPSISRPANAREFYRKRAMEEVSSLQMVEHVLSGIEREHMKKVPTIYDDLQVKKALHRFMQASGDPSSQEHADAEFDLMEETQNWHSALAERDQGVTVGNLRRFCENSKPALSSQALMALARFYRNSPFSELVRCKFEFVMTRLFSREIEIEKRKLLFVRNEMLGHVRTLYENWSSINSYTGPEFEKPITFAVDRLNELTKEAESIGSLDDMYRSQVFDRIRDAKEEIGELFYAPEVVASAITTNVKVGNKFVELIDSAREAYSVEALEDAYGLEYDQLASNVAGKTLMFADLLQKLDDSSISERRSKPIRKFDPIVAISSPKADESSSRDRSSFFNVNRWLVVATAFVFLISGGLYVWADKFAGEQAPPNIAQDVDISSSEIKRHLRVARKSNETMYAVTEPTWDSLSSDEKQAFLKEVSVFAQERELKRVNLLNNKGRSVAYAGDGRIELFGSSGS